ncbi:hypothetical protein Glove_117g414 [Diversispora epigaea]|uniref:Integrase catalytic domain-containing protein n=1 Tax=Diversispora epigaea TaxID=1348612 RepID=A0A397J779_9GLOM|nr:hypothetical protein Glove_117g414 [Diversispora epigaea]
MISFVDTTNGLTERFNRTLVDSLAKVSEDVTDWNKHIPYVLFAYRTAKQATTKIEPFYLVYGRSAQFFIKESFELIENNLLTRLFTLVDNLLKIRGQTQIRITKQQQKQKEYHDHRIKSIKEYQIEDKVLMYEATKQTSYTEKLESKWKGSYYIHDKLYKRIYKLRTLKGKVVLAPIDGSLLKLYHKLNWEPQIVITPNSKRIMAFLQNLQQKLTKLYQNFPGKISEVDVQLKSDGYLIRTSEQTISISTENIKKKDFNPYLLDISADYKN